MTTHNQIFKVGTRSSELALFQTRSVMAHLSELLPEARFEEAQVSSPGDRDLQTDLRESPQDFFTRDLDDGLRSGDLDCAVHSAKDLPDPVPEGIDWCWLPWREDPRDAIVLPVGRTLDELPANPRIGISSERREAYAAEHYPDARQLPIRGNMGERLSQLDNGDFDVAIMAGAALLRLGLADRITEWIPLAELPVPDGQGVLALTFREGDERFLRLRSLFVRCVTIAGAGAGSVGECTLRAIRALERADVCLHDALLDASLLEYLPSNARRMNVGKRCGRKSPRQAEICEQLTIFARRGCRVVRLKGGDPGIFGRLAEEVDALDSLGLPYRVIPGVSSLCTATTGTGMLLTRRGLSRGFSAVTPRMQGGDIAPVDAGVRSRLPVLLFMSLGTIDRSVQELLGDGLPPDTPAAIVFGAGTDEERIVSAELGNIASRLGDSGAATETGSVDDAPGLLLVGEVARYRFNRQCGALEGRRVLLTGSEALQDISADLVHDFGGIPVQRPLIRLATSAAAVAQLMQLPAYDWVTLTSPSAVRCFMEILQEAEVDVRTVPRLMVAGAGTGRELARHGLHADLEPPGRFSAESLIEAARSVIEPGARILRVRSDKAGPALARALGELGAEVTDRVLYQNERIPYDRLPGFDVVFFASSSAVEAFEALWGIENLEGKTVVAIGQPTVDALETRGAKVDLVGPEATVHASLTALAEKCVRERLFTEQGELAR